MGVMLLTAHHLEFLNLKGGYTGSSESTLFKMPHCWKSHVTAHVFNELIDSEWDNKEKNTKETKRRSTRIKIWLRNQHKN